MKKLISIFSAMTLITSTSVSLVACKTDKKVERFDNPSISDKLKEWILAQVKTANGGIYANLTFDEIFKNADLKKLVLRLIDTTISRYYYNAEERKRQKWVLQEGADNSTNYENQFISFIQDIALNQLYSEYMKGRSNNNELEVQMASKGYYPDYQTNGWYVQGIQSPWINKSSFDEDDYTKKYFNNYPVGERINAKVEDSLSNYTDFDKMSEDNKKAALKIRFHDYLKHEIIPNVIQNIITATYLHQNQFKYGKLKDLPDSMYLNKFNALLTGIENQQNTSDIKSNIKMVWEFKAKTSDLENWFKNAGKKFIQTINDLHNHIETSKDDFVREMNKLFNNIDPSTPENIVPQKIDPIFKIKGFKGFAAYDSSGKMFTSDQIDNASLYVDAIKNADSPEILKASSGLDPDYKNYMFYTSNRTYASVVFVLPLYLVDLLNNTYFNYVNEANAGKKLELITNAGGIQYDLNYNWSFTGQFKNKSAPWIYYSNSYLGLTDKAGRDLYDDTGQALHGDEMWKTTLFRWVEYTMAQSSDFQEKAKKQLYTAAFAGNSDNIFAKSLYDEIGKYIQEN